MGTYDAEQRDALELITEFGELAQLTVMTTTEGDEAWDPGVPVPQVLTARMCFLNFKSNANGENYWNGALVHQGDKKVLLAALGLAFAPNLNALITRADGTVWKVVNLKGLDHNGQQILYTLQARQ